MTDTLLRVGSPLVTYSGVGNCWLVDTGALVPIAVPGRRLAFEIAATYVPPAGDPLTHPGELIATAGGAGSDRSLFVAAAELEDARALVPACSSSTAPGSSFFSPEVDDPGATKTFHGREGGVGAPPVVGVGAPTGAAA